MRQALKTISKGIWYPNMLRVFDQTSWQTQKVCHASKQSFAWFKSLREWSNGMTRPCQGRSPGSIPGSRIITTKKNRKYAHVTFLSHKNTDLS